MSQPIVHIKNFQIISPKMLYEFMRDNGIFAVELLMLQDDELQIRLLKEEL